MNARNAPEHREQIYNLLDVSQESLDGPERLEGEACQMLYAWWAGFAPSLPRRADFDPVSHPGLLSKIFLVRALNRTVFDFRLRGNDTERLVGGSTPNLSFRVDRGDAASRNLAAYYRDLLATGRPGRCTGLVDCGPLGIRPFESIDCPLAIDPDGAEFVIGVMDYATDR